MAQIDVSRCDSCGQTVDLAQVEFCPTCQYPVNPGRERRFLEVSIRDLQRVARYGGSSLRVLDLIRRYEGRLQFLHSLDSLRPDLASPAEPAAIANLEASSAAAPVSSENRSRVPLFPQTALPKIPPPVLKRPSTAAAFVTPPAMPVQPAASMRGFSLSGDAMVNVLAAVGSFLVLAGVLSTVFVTSNIWLSFAVVLGIHVAFGAASLITRRSALLRPVSPLYTLIFALLVPLLAFSAYRLVENNLVALSVPYLLTLSALYAAVIYGVLAVVQRFVPFAYLGSVALLVGDLALAQAWHLAFWWWPVVAMFLALAALVALPHPSGPDLFKEQRALLRPPLLMLMYAVLSASAVLAPLLFLASLAAGQADARLPLFVLSCLWVCWYALWLWRTGRTQRTPLLVYLCLMMFLLLGYVLELDLSGYVLLETGVALLYHVLVRVVRGRFAVSGFPGYTLDGLAIGLIVLVMLQTSAVVPLQLLSRTLSGTFVGGTRVMRLLSFPFTASAGVSLDLGALAVGLLVTLDMALARAGFGKTPTRAGWCWLLLLGGLLLSAFYGLEVLLWQANPLWAFLAFSLSLLVCAVLVRRLASAAWAYPLELLTLGEIAFTLLLSFGQKWEVSGGLPLAWAALLYAVLLYQRRSQPAIFPAALLLLALATLQAHLLVVLLLSLLLPLLVAGLSRGDLLEKLSSGARTWFVWMLLGPALIFGLVLSGRDISSGQSVLAGWTSLHQLALNNWLGMSLSAACEMAVLGLAWYAAALLARARLWLLPATLFWLLAMLQPTNNFWVLSLLSPALALLGVAIEKYGRGSWTLPFYLLALTGVCMVIFSGFASGSVLAMSWFLLSYALLAYGIGLITAHRVAFWGVVLYATLAIFLAASQLGDLYRPPIVALVGAALGLVAGRVALLYARPAMRYAWPFYVSALAAALLTGIYGSLGDLARPFSGAIPDALLLYALVAWLVAWIERDERWNWLVALFACWGVLLTLRLTPWYALGTGIAFALAGLLSEQRVRALVWHGVPEQSGDASWRWCWPWYSAFLVAALVLGIWSSTSTQAPVVPGMFVFTLLALAIMLVRRSPDLLVFPAGLAAWSIYLWLSAADPAVLIVAYTLLCTLIYAAQFVWRLWPATAFSPSASRPHHLLSLGGLSVVLLLAVGQGALSPTAGLLAQAGVLALIVLSALIFFYGLLYLLEVARLLPGSMSAEEAAARIATARAVRHRCYYSAALLLSLVVSWELLAAGQTRFDALTLAPASYLIVVAPFLLRDRTLPERRILGQRAALLGSALLLLPALWFSFQGADLLPTFVLLIEALLLLVLGLLLRMRIFILSSAALIIVGTLRLLFLSMPPSVPILLLAFGSLLMILATILILTRHRLQAAWSQWE